MSETAESQLSLRELEELLQKKLHSEPSINIPLQIHCLFREEILIVLIDYPESAIPHPKQVFSLLRQTLKEEQISDNYSISMYLICQEQEQSDILQPLLVDSLESKIAEEASQSLSELQAEKLLESSDRATKKPLPNLLLLGIGAGTGISLVSLLALFYALTRPCVIDNCSVIPQAQQLFDTASRLVRVSSSDREILTAQQQLDEAIQKLQLIPWWSNYRSEAERLLQDYQQQSASLKTIGGAIATAKQATVLTENSPMTSSKNEEIRQLWQTAITSLQQLPSDSPWYAIAQVKIQDYQKNLVGLEQRLEAQQKATTNLKAAKEAAKLARSRQNSAQSPSDWQAVRTTWQTAVQRLRDISPQTSVYPEAQRLLEIYTSGLVIAQTRQNQEQSAANLYQKATETAKLATQAEAKNQWSAAISHWRNALTYVREVPQNTFQYRQAEPLRATYTIAFNRAIKFEQSDRALEKICAQGSKICNYAIADNLIKVNLTYSYMQTVWKTALQAKATGNLQTEVNLLNHISTLEKSLQSLSNTSEKRVEVYNADKQLMMVYEPSH
jgi:hypothetical protein